MASSRGARPRKVADFWASFESAVADVETVIGPLETAPEIAEHTTFLEWAEDLGRKGLKVDGNPFTLDDRRASRFLYSLIPTTAEEAKGKTVVVMKGAQLGMTVWEMLALIYMTLKWGRCWVGSFVPDRGLAALKSSKRLMPILRAIPDAYSQLTESVEPGERKGKNRGEGNVLTRQIGGNMLFFLWTSGKMSTESNPMDVVSFDEVQGMLLADMETTRERLSGSRIGFTLMLSTAKWPDADIDYHYRRGKRYRFHHRCGCEGGCVLDEHIHVDRIDCVAWDQSVKDYRYRCPVCGTFIADNQDGDFVAEDLDARVDSVHYPQTLSVMVSPRAFLESFNNAQDKQNWWNRKAGKPYSDPSQIPITDEVLNRCADLGRAAGVVWEQSGRGYYMGIDQMGGYNTVIVRKRLPDGRGAVVHVEEVRGGDPFSRCDVLMDLYGVAVCVVEQLPNYNDAHRFSGRFPGRVFLCDSYGKLDEDIMIWGDEPRVGASDRRTDDEARSRYTVRIDQYKAMQIAMRRMVDGSLLFPDPDGLVAQSIVDSVMQPVSLLKRVVWHHFKRTALVVEKDEETRKTARKVVKVGIDPHFAFANMLCDVAWSRAHGTSTFWVADATPAAMSSPADALQHAIAAARATPDGTCGTCAGFEGGRCADRGFFVGAADPGCEIYRAV